MGLDTIYTSIQLYKKSISDLLCNIIQGIIKTNEKNPKSAIFQKTQIHLISKKLQSELDHICDNEIKNMDEFERDLKLKKD